MKGLLGLRVILTLFVAVLLPVEQARCALRSLPLASGATQTVRHEDGDHHHGDDPASAPASGDQTDPCCCGGLSLPSATAPASISLLAPVSASTLFAPTLAPAPALGACAVFSGFDSRSRAGPPSDPSATPQAPRGPPYSA